MNDEIREALTALDLEPVAIPGGGLAVRLPSDARGSFVLQLRRTERALAMRAFIMRRPDRLHLEVYARLLHKNLDARDWRFAVDELGDVHIGAYIPTDRVDAAMLDPLLGGAIQLVDAVYEGMARTGFDIPDHISLRPPEDPLPDGG